MLTPCTVCSAHARLLRETSDALLEGGSTGHGRVADACMLLAVRSGANMVSGGEKSDDACLITTLESKIGAELCVRADVNLDEPYYGKLNDLLPLMAVHEQHNQRVLSKHRLAVDVQQSQAAAQSAVQDATSHLIQSVPTTTASAPVTARATKHGPIVSHGVVYRGLVVAVPASEFNVRDGHEYAAVVLAIHSDGRTVPELNTVGPICKLRFIEDDKRFWFSVERVTVFAQRSISPESPVAPDSEERQMHTPPEQTTASPSLNERASPARRRDPRRKL